MGAQGASARNGDGHAWVEILTSHGFQCNEGPLCCILDLGVFPVMSVGSGDEGVVRKKLVRTQRPSATANGPGAS